MKLPKIKRIYQDEESHGIINSDGGDFNGHFSPEFL